MKTRTRRRLSYAEAAFFTAQIPLVLFVLPAEHQIKYLQFISIYAVVRTALAGAQADNPD